MWTPPGLYVCLPLLLVLTGTALAHDVRRNVLPNWLNVTLLVAGIACQIAFAQWAGVWNAAAGFAAGFVILLAMWLMGAAGGGDVKFMGAVGAWFGPMGILWIFVGSGVLTVGATLVRTLFHGLVRKGTLAESFSDGSAGHAAVASAEAAPARTVVPYAVPACAAIWLYVAWLVAQPLIG